MAHIMDTNENFIATDVFDGLNRVLHENYAFIAEATILNTLDPATRCQIYQVGEQLVSIFHGIGMQKSKISYYSVQPLMQLMCLNRFTLQE